MRSWQDLEKALNLKFKRKELLVEALTHKSYVSSNNVRLCNERMEFLGDSILSAVVAHYLYERYPKDDEGKLSRFKSLLVSKNTLVDWAKKIELGSYLLLSGGEELVGGRGRDSILADAYEALIGAIYLDQGFESARNFIMKPLMQKKRIVETDYKSRLQEIIQCKHKQPPTYKLVKDFGPDHDKTFVVEVVLDKTKLGEGQGKSKKEAEQAAALAALRKLKRKGN